MKLRSVELEFPQTGAAHRFLTEVWGLSDAGRRGKALFLRATADQPYVISLAEAPSPAVASITFSGSEDEVKKVYARAEAAGAAHTPMTGFDEPGAARGFILQGREGQPFRFVTEKEPAAALKPDRDRPIQLTHVVLNTRDRDAATRFALEVMGFKLSDRTRAMSFVRCDRTHHSVAFADSELSTLNHLAFEMASIDGVMRGIGRMRDHGHKLAWGPGRHGPGNNVFGYWVSPFGAVIEYTAEVERVDDSYRTGNPEDWKWPPNRGDHWGVSEKDGPSLAEAEKLFRFRAVASAAATA